MQFFYNEYFQHFGNRRRDVGGFEQLVSKLDSNFGLIYSLWLGVQLVEQKCAQVRPVCGPCSGRRGFRCPA